MKVEIEDFTQRSIALLRIIYMTEGLDQRAYAYKSELSLLAKAGFINGTAGQINLTKSGHAFMDHHKLKWFGYEKLHASTHPKQWANTSALAEAMKTFTGQYVV